MTLVIQNLVIVACAVVLLLYLIYQDELLAELPWMEFVSYGLIILLSATANLASKANTIAVERDWIVEICDRDEDRLASREINYCPLLVSFSLSLLFFFTNSF